MINDQSMIADARKWGTLYRVAGISAVIILSFIPVQTIIFALWPPTGGVADIFAIFQKSKFVGLIDMDLLLMIDYVLTLVIYIALWAALRRANPSLALLALIFQIVSMAVYFSSNVAFEMLNLSSQYAATNDESKQTILLAAGQAMLATWQGSAFTFSYIMGCISLILISIVMRRSDIFSRATSYLGLAAGILMVVPPNAGTVGLVVSFLSIIPTIGWLVLLAFRFSNLYKAGR